MTNTHVTNKDLSQKLADAGVDVESEFYWVMGFNDDHEYHVVNGWPEGDPEPVYPAYLLSELLEMMPEEVLFEEALKTTDGKKLWEGSKSGELIVDKHKVVEDMESDSVDIFGVGYKYIARRYYSLVTFTDKNPANAAAKLLLWLIEQGHIDPNNLES